MCRLYALHANEPTRVECSLVLAQNALMRQSRGDREGLMHGHGWGVADYAGGLPVIEKQSWAAFDGEHFQKKAAKVYANTVIAHVRRATVGPPGIENTHPFGHGRWIFAHNGTVPAFDRVRPMLLDAMESLHRNQIHGATDSEHLFRYLLSAWSRHPERGLLDIVQQCLAQVVAWSREVAPDSKVGLNIVLSDGDVVVGSRLDRTLWFLEREFLYHCPICDKPHVHHDPKADYRAVEVASEPLTDEPGWKEVPNGTVFRVDEDYRLHFLPLEADVASA